MHPRLDTTLSDLYSLYRESPEAVPAFVTEHDLHVSDSHVLVMVTVDPSTNPATVSQDVTALQGTVVEYFQDKYDILIAIPEFHRLADLPYVRFVEAPPKPRPFR